MFTVDDLTFDAATHTSRLPDGRDVPHVTAVLGAVGVATDFAELAGYSPRMAQLIEFAAARGTAVHADCHAYDDDDLDWETVDSAVRPYVDAWRICRQNLSLTPLAHARERRIYNSRSQYTGILDGVFVLPDQRRVLIDIKTGDPETAAAHLQTAAYERGWNELHPDLSIAERWAVWLRPDKRVPYAIINYSSHADHWQDFAKFAACLCVFHELPSRRRRRV